MKRVATAGGLGSALGAVGRTAGIRSGEQRVLGDTQEDPAGTPAEQFPSCFGLISVTDRRFLVFDRGSATGRKPERLLAEYPRGTITAMASKKARLKRDLTLTFSDGSTLSVDGGVSQPYDEFEQALVATPGG